MTKVNKVMTVIAAIILMTFSGQIMASLGRVSFRSCLNKDFDVRVSHKTFPLGLFSRKLMISKKKV